MVRDISGPRGLALAQAVYNDRELRTRELKSQGRKIFGYVCLYAPVEIMAAAGFIPFRLFGDNSEPVTLADRHLAPVVCPFMRSLLDVSMKGRHSLLEGVVFAHACDVACMLPNMWRQSIATPYTYFLDTPHTTHAAARAYFKELLNDFRKSLERFSGRPIEDSGIRDAVTVYNEQRALVRRMYNLTRSDPPLARASELLKVTKALMSLPVDEGNDLLTEVIAEILARPVPPRQQARLLLWGSIVDDIALLEMIEGLAADVVIDDTCVGTRAFFTDVPVTEDPLDGLAQYYLVDLKCPRTVREPPLDGNRKDYHRDLEHRFGYLADYVKEWQVNGAVLQSLRYCDIHGYEVPAVKDYLQGLGVPSIYIEHDYSKAAIAPLKTRIQGLTEMIA